MVDRADPTIEELREKRLKILRTCNICKEELPTH